MSYTLPVYDIKGKELKKENLSEALFADDHINEGLIQQYVVMYLANQRYAIANTKNRGEVKRSGRKLYRQKGTGNARVGDAGSPIRRKGGVAFGPRANANYSKAMPQKMKNKALLGALSLKARDGELFGLDAYSAETPKTKEANQGLQAIGIADKTTLVVMQEHNEVLIKSLRNLPQVNSTTVSKLNAYELLTHRNVLFVGDVAGGLEQRVLGSK